MKPVAAFAVGLWTGALVMAGVGVVYWRILDRAPAAGTSESVEQLSQRIQLLQHQQAKTAAEAARLRQTVAELRTGRPPEGNSAPGVAGWILEAVLNPDEQAVAQLEEAAETDLNALDALALLAEYDNAEALTRVWHSNNLTGSGKVRAATLLAATVEVNPRGADWLVGVASDPVLVEAALAGLMTPVFASRLVRGTGIMPPPHFKPNYPLRLRLVEQLRQAVPDETLAPVFDQARQQLAQPVPSAETQ
ncbi:MAG: hypothetical protein PCFJNLEI_00857 [Verrucomicrobiae bacterium]|nr:hypothetical protein [Verrucomicrobiae bacterium]